jgi:serine phosphatase RsbU (regulator of sigma subunit)
MPFRNHSIQLQKGDHIYLFSDGFPDQFGGSKGKKFLYKQFAELLAETSMLDVKQQKDVIKVRFCEWKGDLEQTDDVTVLGFRY